MARVESAQVKELPEKSKSIDKSKSDKDLAKIGGTGGPRRHTAQETTKKRRAPMKKETPEDRSLDQSPLTNKSAANVTPKYTVLRGEEQKFGVLRDEDMPIIKQTNMTFAKRSSSVQRIANNNYNLTPTLNQVDKMKDSQDNSNVLISNVPLVQKSSEGERQFFESKQGEQRGKSVPLLDDASPSKNATGKFEKA